MFDFCFFSGLHNFIVDNKIDLNYPKIKEEIIMKKIIATISILFGCVIIFVKLRKNIEPKVKFDDATVPWRVYRE